MNNDEILAITSDLTPKQRKHLIVELLIQQRTLSDHTPIDRDDCTLIDLKNGLIVGSGICPQCRGWIGRADENEMI